MSISPYLTFSREEWASLRASTPLTLSEGDLNELKSFNDQISLAEVTDVYLPLSRLINLYVTATQALHRVADTFLGQPTAKVPYVIGLAGSVAVGKSTAARLLQALLAQWPEHPQVALVTTDGFLYPKAVLEERGLMKRKGFPESYDARRLIQFMADVKSGAAEAIAPVYSHLYYDIIPGQAQTVRQPDILILEGLNVLQSGAAASGQAPRVFVSDYFDFSIYVDADEALVRQWYVERFLRLRETAFQNPASYFHHYSRLSVEEAAQTAQGIWDDINGPNLRDNIAPTRERAHLILEKGANHAVQRVRLRKV